MIKRKFIILHFLIAIPLITIAQVQVKMEPRHKNVFENTYLRLLDVHIAPRDTTMFHIHSTPSFFLIFTNTLVGVQKKGLDWTTSQNVAGESWYQSFLNDTLIHRVTNCDTVPFHVTDMEILASYNKSRPIKPMPIEVLFENENVIAYAARDSLIDQKVFSERGPIMAQLVEGDKIFLHDEKTNKAEELKKGSYLYVKPERSFYFTVPAEQKINLILLEIK